LCAGLGDSSKVMMAANEAKARAFLKTRCSLLLRGYETSLATIDSAAGFTESCIAILLRGEQLCLKGLGVSS
jgi:hypothetical protein